MAVKQWSAGFLPVLISLKPHTGVLTKPTPSSNLSAGPDRGLLCLNHLGLTRVEAQREERAERTIIRSPNLSLPLSLQPEERSIPTDSSPSSFDNGTWNPSAWTPFKNFSSSPPFLLLSLLQSFSMSLWKQPNIIKAQIITKRWCVFWEGTNPGRKQRLLLPRHEAAVRAACNSISSPTALENSMTANERFVLRKQ